MKSPAIEIASFDPVNPSGYSAATVQGIAEEGS
jgi:hypothetical protein